MRHNTPIRPSSVRVVSWPTFCQSVSLDVHSGSETAVVWLLCDYCCWHSPPLLLTACYWLAGTLLLHPGLTARDDHNWLKKHKKARAHSRKVKGEGRPFFSAETGLQRWAGCAKLPVLYISCCIRSVAAILLEKSLFLLLCDDMQKWYYLTDRFNIHCCPMACLVS